MMKFRFQRLLAVVLIGMVWGHGYSSKAIAATAIPLKDLPPKVLERRLKADLEAVKTYRQGLRRVVEFANTNQALFPANKLESPRLLTREQKESVWAAWRSYLDYTVALDGLEQYYEDFYRLKGQDRERALLICHAATVAKYRFSLDLVNRLENDKAFDTLLNDPVPEVGLPGGTYRRLKFDFLSFLEAAEFAAWETLYRLNGGTSAPLVRAGIEDDTRRLWRFAKGRGQQMTAKNALRLVRRGGSKLWFPVQKHVSEWMGDTKVARKNESLISLQQIRLLERKLEPGDFLLERREWYLSNVGLPGFWPHAALFVGTPELRRGYFTDEETRGWVQQQGEPSGDFEALLKKRYPAAYATGIRPQEHGHVPKVIEAISEGVSFTTMEHSADCDSLAALRPRVSRKEKAVAIYRAFHYFGRPYDFNFDFQTDSSIVCTELVFKAYEAAQGMKGVNFPVVELLGRQVTPANEIVRQFASHFGKPEQQMDLIVFLDGHEKAKSATEASVEAFCESCERPKWHMVMQK